MNGNRNENSSESGRQKGLPPLSHGFNIGKQEGIKEDTIMACRNS